MIRPRVSVALASYNGEQYLEEQLQSILAQEPAPDEVIVSDGGSTDRTVAVAAQVLATRPDVASQVISDGARLRVAANFERAIAATTGDLVALSDQDDVWHPGRLARGVEAFASPDVLLAHSDARLVTASGEPLPFSLFAALRIGPAELRELAGEDAFRLLIRRNLVTGATVMVRRRLLELASPFPREWVHDEWLAITAAAFGRLAPATAEEIDYRQHGRNAIGVVEPTLAHRIRRMLQPRDDRYRDLASRSLVLASRLQAGGAPERWIELARRKASFEAGRAAYPVPRARRITPIVRELRSGSYRDLSSQGRTDVLRDLLQPA